MAFNPPRIIPNEAELEKNAERIKEIDSLLKTETEERKIASLKQERSRLQAKLKEYSPQYNIKRL